MPAGDPRRQLLKSCISQRRQKTCPGLVMTVDGHGRNFHNVGHAAHCHRIHALLIQNVASRQDDALFRRLIFHVYSVDEERGVGKLLQNEAKKWAKIGAALAQRGNWNQQRSESPFHRQTTGRSTAGHRRGSNRSSKYVCANLSRVADRSTTLSPANAYSI
jgi:hypothetical protein